MIKIDDNKLALGDAFNGTPVVASGPFPLAPGVSGVDAARDVIVFGQPHYFHTGDAVWYDDGSLGPVVAGGRLFYVRVIDERTIKLADTPAAALAPLTSFTRRRPASSRAATSSISRASSPASAIW